MPGLTDDGRELLRSCSRILIALHEAERVCTAVEKLRVELPTALGRLRIAPTLGQLTARYTDLRVDASFSDFLCDLFRARLIELNPIREPCDTVRYQALRHCVLIISAARSTMRDMASGFHGPTSVRLHLPRTDRQSD